VRLPGDNAAQCIDAAKARGVDYDAATWSALARAAEELGVAMPPVIKSAVGNPSGRLRM
jgi:LDH2 family malate/lactate/ureidoglycolate dehydrogenase